jgi:CrcB protein
VSLLWVCLGGAAGSGARFLISVWMLERFGPIFPLGTLTVNLLGSFLMGGLMFAGIRASMLPPALWLGLTTGVMGGFTTYSAFSYETMRYLQEGAWSTAMLYVALTGVGCLLACLLGWTLAEWFLGAG